MKKRDSTKAIKAIIKALCVLMLSVLMITPTLALTTERVEKDLETLTIVQTDARFEGSKLLDNIGEISTKEALRINGKEYLLYCTFDDPDEALNNIYTEAENIIEYLKERFALQNFSASSAREYYFAALQMLDDPQKPDWYTEDNIEFRSLMAFYDIFENEEQNEVIKQGINSISRTSDLSLDFAAQLPNDSYIALLEDNDTLSTQSMQLQNVVLGFDTSAGISYASAHAENPNTLEYGHLSGRDCTNFVSQILENGGVSQDVYSSVYSGWWHTTTINNRLGTNIHHYSNSWVGADTFAKYMGVGFTTKSHKTFSSNIQAGDFIAYDEVSDGDWQHMGFVTAKGRYSIGLGYTDYKVAQHTHNYHRWVSDTNNNWENVETKGGTYGRIRR